MPVSSSRKQGELSVQIESLVSAQRINAARALLASVGSTAPGESDLLQWSAVLAEPRTALARLRGKDRTQDYEWLRNNAEKYRGQWVALLAGELVAASDSLKGVLALTKSTNVSNAVLIHKL